jgi:hypothetical protein
MMGTREKLRGGDEWDAFCRRCRRVVKFAPGRLKRIKRQFWKRFRKRMRPEHRPPETDWGPPVGKEEW